MTLRRLRTTAWFCFLARLNCGQALGHWCAPRPDTHVAPSCASPASLPREYDVQDVSACRAKCEASPECKSVQYRAGGCQYCSSTGEMTRPEQGVILHTRLCEASARDGAQHLNAAPWCPPLQDTHVMPSCSSPESLPREYDVPDVHHCKQRCAKDPQCKSFQHREGGCQYCSHDGSSTRVAAGITLYTKLCGASQEVERAQRQTHWCPAKSNTHVAPSCGSPASLPRDEGIDDVAVCKAKCDANPACKSFQRRHNGCQYCSHDGTATRPEAGVELYTKLCGATEAKNAAAEHSSWCPPKENTHTAPSCSSPAALPRDVNVVDVSVCKAKCAAHLECKSVQYRDGGCQYCSTDGAATRQVMGVTLYTRRCGPAPSWAAASSGPGDWCPPKADTHVAPSCASPQDLPREPSVLDVSLCLAKCLANAACRAVQYRGGGCQYCSMDGSSTRPEPGVTLYTRLCGAAHGARAGEL
eukprot:TRINITY_DN19264_c1_g2_i1.p1 TRINITY_DN19264_c1_g2~~TRINITY_DN19264_c1_g2_i1.p1  ORF type:complete len:483 (-),score=55.23 TRINITY_DN19264_c1_g2_i1:190-1602(-)